MSALGLIQTLRATGLVEAFRKDLEAGISRPVCLFVAGGGTTFSNHLDFAVAAAGEAALSIGMEFKCGVKAVGMFTLMDVGSNAPDYKRGINVFIGKLAASEHIRGQVYVSALTSD